MASDPGGRLRLFREHLGITQADLAARAEMDVTKLSRLETGELVMRVIDLETLVEALGLTMTKFYGRTPKPIKKAA